MADWDIEQEDDFGKWRRDKKRGGQTSPTLPTLKEKANSGDLLRAAQFLVGAAMWENLRDLEEMDAILAELKFRYEQGLLPTTIKDDSPRA